MLKGFAEGRDAQLPDAIEQDGLISEHVRANAPIMPPPPKKRGRPKKETRTDD